MTVYTNDDCYEDVRFVSMEHGWLVFEEEDVGFTVVPVSTVVELHFPDVGELECFRRAAASVRFPVWTS